MRRDPTPSAPNRQTAATVEIAGQRITLDHSGAAWLPETGDLLVADLHFEKGSAFAARGQGLLPPYDTAETLRRLEQVCVRLKPKRVICLGDTLHDLAGEARMAAGDRQRLARLVAKQDWVWIAGNHDPEPPADFGGTATNELRIGDLVLCHDVAERAPDAGLAAGEVCGHYHPKAAVRVRGRRISGRCFATDGRRLVMPAFGAFAGGLNAREPAIAGLLAGRFRVYLIGPSGLFAFRHDQLLPDPKRAA
ncbi:MAG: ligase-associated DNA damage response endonuclease PdeM [Alphaproteobacteria bacterium]